MSAVEHVHQLFPALRCPERRLHAQIVQKPHEALGNVQVGAEVVGLGEDDVAAASKPPGIAHDLEEIDGGVVADDHVPGARSDHVGDVVPELPWFLHPTLGRPRPPALVAPSLRQQATDAVRHLHRHGAHGVRVEVDAARSAARELVGVAGERVAPIEREAGFQRMHEGTHGEGVRPGPLLHGRRATYFISAPFCKDSSSAGRMRRAPDDQRHGAPWRTSGSDSMVSADDVYLSNR